MPPKKKDKEDNNTRGDTRPWNGMTGSGRTSAVVTCHRAEFSFYTEKAERGKLNAKKSQRKTDLYTDFLGRFLKLSQDEVPDIEVHRKYWANLEAKNKEGKDHRSYKTAKREFFEWAYALVKEAQSLNSPGVTGTPPLERWTKEDYLTRGIKTVRAPMYRKLQKEGVFCGVEDAMAEVMPAETFQKEYQQMGVDCRKAGLVKTAQAAGGVGSLPPRSQVTGQGNRSEASVVQISDDDKLDDDDMVLSLGGDKTMEAGDDCVEVDRARTSEHLAGAATPTPIKSQAGRHQHLAGTVWLQVE